MRILIIFIFLISNSVANEITNIKNLVINKELKKYEDLTFLDSKKEQINLKDFKGKLILLNFWATWCAPCKEEMPSLDLLDKKANLDNLRIFPINVGQESEEKAINFFNDLKIKNLDTFFDSPITLAKKFGLRAPMVGHLGDGNFHVLLPYDPEKKETYQKIRKFSDILIEKTLELEGTITGEHGVGLHKKDYLLKEHGDNLPVMKSIKRTIDPNNIMNPGKIFDLN